MKRKSTEQRSETMKLTDRYYYGILDQNTGNIVGRSEEGWRLAGRVKTLNNKEYETTGNDSRFSITMKQD